jgi:hypothetical protein
MSGKRLSRLPIDEDPDPPDLREVQRDRVHDRIHDLQLRRRAAEFANSGRDIDPRRAVLEEKELAQAHAVRYGREKAGARAAEELAEALRSSLLRRFDRDRRPPLDVEKIVVRARKEQETSFGGGGSGVRSVGVFSAAAWLAVSAC